MEHLGRTNPIYINVKKNSEHAQRRTSGCDSHDSEFLRDPHARTANPPCSRNDKCIRTADLSA